MSFRTYTQSLGTPSGAEKLIFLSCTPLVHAGFQNYFSTRVGGISPLPKNALNLAFQDDEESNVKENRKRFLSSIQHPNVSIFTLKQTHSDKLYFYKDANYQREPLADSCISQLSNQFLGVKTADCVPILMGDPNTKTMVTIHVGWKGLSKDIIIKTVNLAKSQTKLVAKETLVAIGPHACSTCYEVGLDVASHFMNKSWFQKKPNGKFLLNLRKAIIDQLVNLGFNNQNIVVSDFCTIERNDLFFSYRREGKGPMGRQLSIIGRLKNNGQQP